MTELHISTPNKGLPIGSKAPTIETQDIDGNDVNLANLLDNHRGVLIDFFRGGWWPYCIKHLKLLTQNISELEKHNVKLIAVAKDSSRRLIKMKEKYNFNIPIISDRGGKIAKSYNMLLTEKTAGHDDIQVNIAIPSKVLINKNGDIVWHFIGAKEDRPTIEIITNAIDKFL